MDSEHGSVNCHFPPDFASLPPTNNHPYYPSTSQRVGGVQMVGLGMVSPSSSQSSLSSESSAAATAIAREFPRPRSGSLQEEVAYAQGNFVFLFSLLCAVLKKKPWHEWVQLVYICFTFCCCSHKKIIEGNKNIRHVVRRQVLAVFYINFPIFTCIVHCFSQLCYTISDCAKSS
jgi:hypothetical protein